MIVATQILATTGELEPPVTAVEAPGGDDAGVQDYAPAPGVSGHPEYLTVSEVARILRVCDQTVRRMVRRGDLPYIRAGKKILVDAADLPEPGRVMRPDVPDARPRRPRPVTGRLMQAAERAQKADR